MSLGITQLKAPASRKWSCSQRFRETFLEKICLCSVQRTEQTTCYEEVLGKKTHQHGLGLVAFISQSLSERDSLKRIQACSV